MSVDEPRSTLPIERVRLAEVLATVRSASCVTVLRAVALDVGVVWPCLVLAVRLAIDVVGVVLPNRAFEVARRSEAAGVDAISLS